MSEVRPEAVLQTRDLVLRHGPEVLLTYPDLVALPGTHLAVTGPSGVGKTSLLHLIAGLLTPFSGSVRLGEVEISSLGERQRDAFRARNVGYMFQDFHLMPGYTALENVTLALGLCGLRGSAALKRARETLQRVGLGNRLQHTSTQLSTGERQRVALARAIAPRPALLLADEPTAHLDRVRSHDALDLLIETAREVNATLLVVTHDPLVVEQFEHQLSLGELAAVSTAGVPISDVPVLGARRTA